MKNIKLPLIIFFIGIKSVASGNAFSFKQVVPRLAAQLQRVADTSKKIAAGQDTSYTFNVKQRNKNFGAGINVASFGAKGDGVTLAKAGTIKTGSSTLTAAGAHFNAGDKGKLITVDGAGKDSTALSSTIVSVQSAEQVTLGAAAVNTVSTAEVSYGSDDSKALQAAFDYCGYQTGILLKYTRAYASGGNIYMGNNKAIYMVSQHLFIAANTKVNGNGSLIKFTSPDAYIRSRPIPGQYDIDGISIDNLNIDGNNIANNCLFFTRTVEATLSNMKIFRAVSHGIRMEQSQYFSMINVNVTSCRGYGIWLGKSVDKDHKSNNNRFYGCKFEKNILGGARIEDGEKNAFIGSTFQFSNNGAGLSLYGAGAKSNSATECHFEGNKYHVEILSVNPATDQSRPYATAITDAFFVVDKYTRRFVVNEGLQTSIISPGQQSQNLDPVDGTNAPYQQSSICGGMMLFNPMMIAGQADLVCYQNGQNLSAANMNPMRVSIIQQTPNGVDFHGTLAFNTVKRKAINDQDYTVTASDDIIEYTTLTARRAVKLPAAKTMANKTLIIKDGAGTAEANPISINALGAETIDGEKSKSIAAKYGYLNIYSTGKSWLIVGGTSAH